MFSLVKNLWMPWLRNVIPLQDQMDEIKKKAITQIDWGNR